MEFCFFHMGYSNASACINASPLDGCSVLNEKDEIALSPIANPGGRGTAPLRHRAAAGRSAESWVSGYKRARDPERTRLRRRGVTGLPGDGLLRALGEG